MPTILLSNKYDREPHEIIQGSVPEGFNLVTLDAASQEEFKEKAVFADYILASGRLKINKEILDKASNLKMLQRTGVGLDSLDLDSIKEHNIPVYVNQGVNAQSAAEHALLLILSALRRIPAICENTKKGIWKKQAQGVTTRELASQTVGVIGMGNIGRTLARLLNGFGSEILYYDAFRQSRSVEQQLGIQFVDINTLFRRSNIISLHCPLTEETREIINFVNIEKMKDGVIIVNTARGQLVNEVDLLGSLNRGKVGWACLDVFSEEPLKNLELVQHPNIICTPHIAGVTYDSFYRMMQAAMRNIENFEQGRLSEIEQYRLKY